jgi:hypothetical protein
MFPTSIASVILHYYDGHANRDSSMNRHDPRRGSMRIGGAVGSGELCATVHVHDPLPADRIRIGTVLSTRIRFSQNVNARLDWNSSERST